MRIAFYGSSLLSSYWNGAATYYRGMLSALARRGHEILFLEPDAFGRQQHRDIDPPPWAEVRVWPATEEGLRTALSAAGGADVVVKASGVGVHDTELLEGAMRAAQPGAIRIFWDVDAPATLAEMAAAGPEHPLRRALPGLDLVLTYGGGPPVVERYAAIGARRCVPVYNALDPETHHPVPPEPRFAADLSFLGNRLPDREARVAEFFLRPARAMPERRFLIGGNGWEQHALPPNLRALGHVFTRDHNAFNTSPLAVLNIAREDMAAVGYSPATRVFEAAGAAACLITDAWTGLELFLKDGEEVLATRDGQEVAEILAALTPERARAIGEAARARILAGHTYDRRAEEVDALLRETVVLARRRGAEEKAA
jgi:spore maturation protein CgeB